MENICRLCMISVTDVVCLVEETVDDKFTISTSGKYFEDCLGIKLEELPDFYKICTNCNSQLINFHAFKIQAVEHHKKLLKLYHDTQSKDESKDTTIVKTKVSNQYSTRTKRRKSSRITKIERKNISNSKTVKSQYNEDNSSENEDKISVRNLSETSGSVNVSRNPTQANLNTNEEQNLNLNEDLLEVKIEVQHFDFVNTNNSEYLNEDNKDSKDSRISPQEEDAEKPEELKLISRKAGGSSFWRYPCTKCNRRFHTEASYDAHQNAHKGLPLYSCKQCGKSFTTKRNLDHHINRHNNVRDFKCDVCGKRFVSVGYLNVHKQYHDKTKFFVCHICGKKYTTKQYLKGHFETHVTTRNNECSICLKKYKTKGSLRSHMETVHWRKKEFLCPLCGKVFYRGNHLKKHLKVHEKREQKKKTS